MRCCRTKRRHVIVKPMQRILITILAGMSIALTGCATLSRDECKSGDWHKIGMQDGSDGRTEDRFKKHAKACELDRSDVSRTAYMEARQQGLAKYCTHVRGYREGSLGQKYYGVCPPQTASQFLTGFEFGQRINQTEIRLSDTANGIYSVSQKLLQPTIPEADRAALLREQTRLRGEEARLQGELEKLRNQADTLVSASRKKN